MPRYALLLAYDGTDFAGWWRQPGQRHLRSVAGELDAAFRRLGERHASVVGASRTDSGVHALGQVAHVDLGRDWLPHDLVAALNRHLPRDCSCRAAAAVTDDWHAVHQAVGKRYRYAIDVDTSPDPFGARYAWRPPFIPALDRLQDAAREIAAGGTWKAFARRGEHRSDWPMRRLRATWRRSGRLLVCTIAGPGFTYRLVRSLVGGMVAVAHGGCTSDDWRRAIAGEITAAAKQQAPALGLRLDRVRYRPEPEWC